MSVDYNKSRGYFTVKKFKDGKNIFIGNYRTIERADQASDLFDKSGVKMDSDFGSNCKKTTDMMYKDIAEKNVDQVKILTNKYSPRII